MSHPFEGAAVIHACTRAQAIEDGFLVDVSATAREAGIRFPVALSAAVWEGVVVPDEASKRQGQDIQGRLWDVLWMFRCAALGPDTDLLIYSLLVVQKGVRRRVQLKAVCGPGDTAEPVITIMLPDED